MSFEITANTKKYLLAEARHIIAEKLGLSAPNEIAPDNDVKSECGAFVTIHKNGKLRGCIGFILAAGALDETIRHLASEAAFADPRFTPLTREEYPEIDIEITALSPLMEAKADDVTVGRDGLFIVKGSNRGVLLPQVATEYKWDKETFLRQTCIKAGLAPNEWKTNSVTIYRFEGNVFSEADML